MTDPKDLINWVALSKHLTGRSSNISRTRIPKKYRDKVSNLIMSIEIWDKHLKK
jgi:hypothetical protein